MAKTLRQFLDERWAEKGVVLTTSDLPILKETEWSPKFEQMMRERLIQGAFRYGRLRDRRKPQWDRIARVVAEMAAYKEDGNLERLVDAANMLLLEFEESNHPKRHLTIRGVSNSLHTEQSLSPEH